MPAAVLSRATGRVTTGFSFPYVGIYSNEGTNVTYSDVQELARGVSVNITLDSSDRNVFYANNIEAESESGRFNGGTLGLTVDGLLQSAEALIMGLTEGEDGIEYGDGIEQPFVGIGFITRYRSGDVTSFVPTIIRKVKFDIPGNEASTQEENIDWQTRELNAVISRSDREDRSWKWEGGEFATEAEAVTALTTKFGGSASDSSSDTPSDTDNS